MASRPGVSSQERACVLCAWECNFRSLLEHLNSVLLKVFILSNVLVFGWSCLTPCVSIQEVLFLLDFRPRWEIFSVDKGGVSYRVRKHAYKSSSPSGTRQSECEWRFRTARSATLCARNAKCVNTRAEVSACACIFSLNVSDLFWQGLWLLYM